MLEAVSVTFNCILISITIFLFYCHIYCCCLLSLLRLLLAFWQGQTCIRFNFTEFLSRLKKVFPTTTTSTTMLF